MWWIVGLIVIVGMATYLKLRALSTMLDRYQDAVVEILDGLSRQQDDLHSAVCPVPLEMPDEQIFEVVKQVCQHVGLNGAEITLDFKISSTGKLNEILHFSSQALNQAHPVATVRDVVKVLSHARN